MRCLLQSLRVFLCALMLAGNGQLVIAAASVLEPKPVASPDGTYSANIEWEDIGFLGLLRMTLFDKSGKPRKSVELPEMNPDPANLIWIDNEWVGVESFIGERGGGFFYVHAPSGRGYLVDILQPQPNDDWLITFATNDTVSSEPVTTVSKKRTSLFPIVLRDLPTQEVDYFLPEFVAYLKSAVDAFTDFRRKQQISEIHLLSDADIRDNLGGVVLAAVDDEMKVVYFPAGTTTTKEMLERVQMQDLPKQADDILRSASDNEMRVRWLEGGEYVVEAPPPGIHTLAEADSLVRVATGQFVGVSDAPYVAPTPTPKPVEKPKVTPKVSVSKSKSSSSKSSSKTSSKSSSSKKKPSKSD